PRQQVVLADDFVGSRDKSNQDVERACAQFNWSAVSREQSFPCSQPIGSKRQDLFVCYCNWNHRVIPPAPTSFTLHSKPWLLPKPTVWAKPLNSQLPSSRRSALEGVKTAWRRSELLAE